MERTLQVPRTHFQQMLVHLREALPLEACGLMAGRDGLVQQLYRIDNVLRSPTAYEMDPRQQLQAMLSAEANGWELLVIYHSHPQGPERPSETDIACAYYPETAHLIVSFRDREQPAVRAFAIADGLVDEILLEIV